MSASTIQSSLYFKTSGNMSYNQALILVLEDIQEHKEAYYVYAMLLKLQEDDECKPLKYLDALKEGMNHGSILCHVMFGILKQQGKVMERHPIQAKKIVDTHLKALESLAYEDDMYALGLLGFMHTHGLFVEKNIQTAMRYLHGAVKLDFVDAFHQLGYLYQFASPYQDVQKGQTYVKRALDANYSPTWFAKGLQGLKEKQMDEAIHYLEKASLLGNIHAMFTLGTLFESQKQHQKGFEYFLHAANLNHVKGMYMTGLAYQSGKGVVKDEDKAVNYMMQAAEHDDTLALFTVANIELKKPNPNLEFVYDYLHKAALKQHPLANHQLASMYEEGKYMLKDVITALSFYERAIIMQFPPSLYQAAKILVEGVYVPKNIPKAIQYLEMAAEKKYKPAILMLETLKQKTEKNTYAA
jgi:TPR repeat protein